MPYIGVSRIFYTTYEESPVKQTTAVNGKKGLVSTMLFVFSYLIARIVMNQVESSEVIRIGAALLPVAPFIWMLWDIIKRVRGMDELQQRIQLEALAIAYPLALLLLMSLGLLELATSLPPEDLSYRHVWLMLPLLYFIGLRVARGRYK